MTPELTGEHGPTASAGLLETFEAARSLGFLGPGSVDAHVDHAAGFATALAVASGVDQPESALDLGAGGGIPGLVLAERWPLSRWLFLDANERRTVFLHEAVSRLGFVDRVVVLRARAEEAANDPELRGRFAVVVSRSFGAAPVTAECAAGFLEVGGHLVVSEPSGETHEAWAQRWPTAGLAALGLVPVRLVTGGPSFSVLRQARWCPEGYPRRTGIPRKRPLY